MQYLHISNQSQIESIILISNGLRFSISIKYANKRMSGVKLAFSLSHQKLQTGISVIFLMRDKMYHGKLTRRQISSHTNIVKNGDIINDYATSISLTYLSSLAYTATSNRTTYNHCPTFFDKEGKWLRRNSL